MKKEKELKKEIEKNIEKSVEKSLYRFRKIGYIAIIIFNIILLYVFNNLLNWHISFLKESFAAVLWLINVSIISTIAFNLLYIFYDQNWFKNFLEILLNLVSLLIFYSFYKIFPFQFSGQGNDMAKIVLIIFIILVVIVIIVNIIKFVYNILGFPKNK